MASLADKEILVTNIQRFSLQDGPGIRTSVFLKGCPLKCAWCHNPECINPHNEIFQKIEKCVRCGACAKVCPEGAISPPQQSRKRKEVPSFGKTCCTGQTQQECEENDYQLIIDPPQIDRAKCTNCMKCVEACDYDAITKAGNLMTVGEVLDEIKRDEVFYKTSGGGATISGGDPLFHPDVTLALLKLLKENGISTALDTSGFARWEAIEALMDYVDLVLFDIKHLDDEKHIKWTGVSNAIIIENAKKIGKKGTEMRLRLPIIHDVNFWDLNHPRSVVEIARQIGQSVTGIDLLPYHEFGESKSIMLGRRYFFSGFPNLYEEDVADYVDVLRRGGPWEVSVGGMLGVKKDSFEA